MQAFQLQIPTRIHFGKGVLDKLGEEVKRFGDRALLVYGQGSIKRNGIYDTVMAQLSAAGVHVTEHPGVKPNPVLSHAQEGVRLATENKLDVVVAVGGGSVVDEAKAIAAGARNEPPLWDYFARKRDIGDALPVVAVQTQPATSSELNAASVLTNETTSEKFGVRADSMTPRVAFLDPTLTTTIPVQYTAYACTDILSHMMEGYFTTSSKWIPIQDGMVEGISRAIMESMERVLADPNDPDARAAIMWGGALAWSGLLNAGTDGASIPNHMIEHPLSAHYDVTHGAGLSIVIPAWLKYMKPRISHRIVQFGQRILGMADELESLDESARADAVIEALEAWYRKIGTPVTLEEAGITNPDIDALTEHALQLRKLWSVPGYTEQDIRAIYDLCSEG